MEQAIRCHAGLNNPTVVVAAFSELVEGENYRVTISSSGVIPVIRDTLTGTFPANGLVQKGYAKRTFSGDAPTLHFHVITDRITGTFVVGIG